MNKEQTKIYKNIISLNNPVKRYDLLIGFMNSLFVDSLNGLNLTSLINIDEINISDADDILKHLISIKQELKQYTEQLKTINERMKKLNTIKQVINQLIIGDETTNETNTSTSNEELNIEELENMIKRLESLNVEAINKVILH